MGWLIDNDSMRQLTVRNGVGLGNKKLFQGRVDLVELDVRCNPVDGCLNADRPPTEEESAVGKSVGQNSQI